MRCVWSTSCSMSLPSRLDEMPKQADCSQQSYCNRAGNRIEPRFHTFPPHDDYGSILSLLLAEVETVQLGSNTARLSPRQFGRLFKAETGKLRRGLWNDCGQRWHGIAWRTASKQLKASRGESASLILNGCVAPSYGFMASHLRQSGERRAPESARSSTEECSLISRHAPEPIDSCRTYSETPGGT